MYEVRLRSRRVQRELDSLRESDYHRIVARLGALAKDARPPGSEKLQDSVYRVRVGDVRIIYLIDDGNKRVEVGGIRRRSERTYGALDDLFR